MSCTSRPTSKCDVMSDSSVSSLRTNCYDGQASKVSQRDINNALLPRISGSRHDADILRRLPRRMERGAPLRRTRVRTCKP